MGSRRVTQDDTMVAYKSFFNDSRSVLDETSKPVFPYPPPKHWVNKFKRTDLEFLPEVVKHASAGNSKSLRYDYNRDLFTSGKARNVYNDIDNARYESKYTEGRPSRLVYKSMDYVVNPIISEPPLVQYGPITKREYKREKQRKEIAAYESYRDIQASNFEHWCKYGRLYNEYKRDTGHRDKRGGGGAFTHVLMRLLR